MAENPVPTSFIPHDTGVVSPVSRRRSAGLNDLLLLCAIVLLVASGALGGGVFLYKKFLATDKASKISQLEREKEAFQPALIAELTKLDDRMHAADRILGLHIAPTAFFAALEQSTLTTVSFQTLDFDISDAQNMTIKMAGIAQSVNSIALQADLFSKNGVIASPIFSNIARQSDGVHFNLAAIVNPTSINYAALVASVLNAGASNQTPPAENPAPESTSPFNATDLSATSTHQEDGSATQ